MHWCTVQNLHEQFLHSTILETSEPFHLMHVAVDSVSVKWMNSSDTEPFSRSETIMECSRHRFQ